MKMQDLFNREISIDRDLRYGDEERNRLDVYRAVGTENAPVLIWFYGGGWRSGDKRLFEHLGRAFAIRGICAVTVNYRLTPEVRFPSHARDAAKAVAWVAATISSYGGDPTKIVLAGHSAGAHLAAITWLDKRFLDAHRIDRRHIRAGVFISGVYDLPDHVDSTVFTGREEVIEAFGEDPGDLQTASPIRHVEDLGAPTLVMVAEDDPEGLKRQARSFADELREHRNEVIFLDVKGRDHFSIVRRFGPSDDTAAESIAEFVHAVTGDRPASS